MSLLSLLLPLFFTVSSALGAPTPAHVPADEHLPLVPGGQSVPEAPASVVRPTKHSLAVARSIDQLSQVRAQVMELEQGLMDALKARSQARNNLKKLQTLILLRRQERVIGQKRMKELEDTVHELELRREALLEKVSLQQKSVRKFLIAIEGSSRGVASLTRQLGLEGEALEAPRRKLLANLTSRGLKELEVLRADLSDADQLEARIQEEKQQLAYLFQDLNEKESVLELNRQLQVDLMKRTGDARVAQLESYRKLKTSQAQVERMIQDFNARRELEKAVETERQTARLMFRGEFERLKGKLGLPVNGKILTSFGRAFDPRSRLYIFKKGVDIQAEKSQAVQAIFGGKVAFSGELPDYGRVTIIDHGNHFYSLCAHLGELSRKAGDSVAAGDAIGLTDETGVVYFEIRSRNVAVNPLQWVSGSFSLKQ